MKIRKEIAYTDTTPAVQSNEVLKCVKCYCCEGPHRLTECNEFCKKTYEDKCLVVKSKNLCFKRHNGKHFSRDCKSKQNCTVPGCTGTLHHKLLHRSKTPTQDSGTETNDMCNTVQVVNHKVAEPTIHLNVVPVKVRYMGNEETIYALLDQGSTSSFCDNGLANLLQASGSQRCLALRTLTSPKFLRTMSFSLSVQALNGGMWIEIPDVVVVDNIPVKPNAVPENEVLKSHEYLKDVHLQKINETSVKLLIGANVPQVFRVEEIKPAPILRYPDAVKSPLGWSLLGPSMIGCLTLANQEYSHQQLELTSSMFV